MNEQQVIALINAQIKANDNKEITGNILNLVLKEMVAQPNLLIGDLSSLSTGISNDLVSAINWLLTQISGGNIVIHTGQNNPNETPPATYTVGDFYSQLDVMNNPLYLWQYTGTEWARISNYIDDSIEALDTTWSSYKISEAIKGDRLNSNGTIVLDGNEIAISDLSWWIQGNPYILIPPFSDTIPYTSEPGLSRKDIVVAIQANSLIRIPGEEGSGVVQPPQVPPNTLLVTEFDVYHDSVGEPTDPITGDQYIKKSSEAFVQVVPTTAEIKLNIDNNRNFVVNAPDEVTIVGVVKTATNGSTSTDTNWSGSDLHIYRKIGSNNVKIKHHDIPNWTAMGYTLYFPDGQDYDMDEGELLTFKIMQHGTLITNSSIMAFPIYIFAGSSKGSTSNDISNESTVVGATVTEALDELQEQLGALVNLTNDDNTLYIEDDIIRLNVTGVTEEFICDGSRNFEMTNTYTSIENVFIQGVRISEEDYTVISEQEIEIEETVTLLDGDNVTIQGIMFIIPEE